MQLSSLLVKGPEQKLTGASSSVTGKTVDTWTVKRNLLEFGINKFCVCSQKNLSWVAVLTLGRCVLGSFMCL